APPHGGPLWSARRLLDDDLLVGRGGGRARSRSTSVGRLVRDALDALRRGLGGDAGRAVGGGAGRLAVPRDALVRVGHLPELLASHLTHQRLHVGHGGADAGGRAGCWAACSALRELVAHLRRDALA